MKGISPGLERKVSVRKIDPPDRLSFSGQRGLPTSFYSASFRIPSNVNLRISGARPVARISHRIEYIEIEYIEATNQRKLLCSNDFIDDPWSATMPTDDTPNFFEFEVVEGRKLVAAFDAGYRFPSKRRTGQ